MALPLISEEEEELAENAKDLRVALSGAISADLWHFEDVFERPFHIQLATGYAGNCVWIGNEYDRMLLDRYSVQSLLVKPLMRFSDDLPLSQPAQREPEPPYKDLLHTVLRELADGDLTPTTIKMAESIVKTYERSQ